jgi:GNAT superfamily N-acetyltransferase
MERCIQETHLSGEKLSFEPGGDAEQLPAAPNPASKTMSDRNPAGLTTISPVIFRLPGGDAVTVRPIHSDDAGRLQAYLRDLSAHSRRNRFLGALSELSPREIARLAAMDRPGELALVAFADGGREGEFIAEAIHVIAPETGRCEFALSVADAWQRRGLGTLLLRLIECRARLIGARDLFGDVLRDNAAMTGLARKLGFALRGPVADARLVEIVKDLTLPASGPPCDERFAQVRPIAA